MINKDLFSTLKKISIQQYKTDVGFRTLVESVKENIVGVKNKWFL